MKPALRLLAPGLARRSLDEAKRFAQLALSADGLEGPSKPRLLIDFEDPEMVPACKTMSDAELGGFSTANLTNIAANRGIPRHARWHGSISTELPRDNPQVHRTGFAGWRNLDRPWTVFGKSVWDLSLYNYLALRVKSDGRKYFVNIQTESIVLEDLHQHRLLTKTPGQWETVFIRISSFVRTNYGEVVEPQTEMMSQKVRTIGMSTIDRVPGPFGVSIHKIWATLNTKDEEILGSTSTQEEMMRQT